MRSAFYTLTVLVALGLAGGCAHGPRYYPREVAFVEKEYAPYTQPGTAVIEGVSSLTTPSGKLVYGAGSSVYLNPVTSYSREWFDKYVRGGMLLEDPDPRQDRYVRQAAADRYGRFRFEKVPAGEYYLASPIVWSEPRGSRGQSKQGRIAYAHLRVADGAKVTASLSNVAPWPSRTRRRGGPKSEGAPED